MEESSRVHKKSEIHGGEEGNKSLFQSITVLPMQSYVGCGSLSFYVFYWIKQAKTQS